MKPIDIVIIAVVSIVILSIIGVFIYKKVKGIPIDDCGCGCKSKKKTKKMLANIKNELDSEKECCCCKDK